MELYEIKVDTTQSLTLPWQEAIIMPIGDVQLGDQGCDIDRLKRAIDWGMAHNAYFLGMGEYIDIASPSNRARLIAANLYDSTMDAFEEIVRQKIRQFLRIVKGTEGRWLGLLEGHHLYEFRDGTTTDTRIAESLKSKFLGTCAFVRIQFNRRSEESTRGHPDISCIIWCHHGAGGGQKVSAPLNKLENIVPYFDADIYLMGHQHKKVAAPLDRTYMDKSGRLKHKTVIIANTGGYLRGYYQGATQGGNFPRGGYVERGMRPPVALGGILLYVRPARETKNGKETLRLDLNVSL